MRLLVMFDLPTDTKEERRDYRLFRKKLISEGFLMIQYSVYVRVCVNRQSAQFIEKRVGSMLPDHGLIQSLIITEKQYNSMHFLLGEKKKDVRNLSEGKISVLATNSSVVFSDLIAAVQGFNDQLLVTDDDYSSLEVTKALDWDTHLVLSRSVETHYAKKLVAKLAAEIDDDNRNRLNEQGRELFAAVQESLFMSTLPLEVTYDGDIKRLLSYCNPKLIRVGHDDFYGIITDDLKIHLELDSKACLCLSNVANYLSKDEFCDLTETVAQLQVPLLLIEFTEMERRDFYGNADVLYIDQDFVDWQL